MTIITILAFGVDRIALGRVRDTLIPALYREFLARSVEAGDVYWSEKHGNYSCYIEVDVGRELGSILIPSGTTEKPAIKLREVKENASKG